MLTQSIKHEKYFYLVFNSFKEFYKNDYQPKIKSIVSSQTSKQYQFIIFALF